MRIPAKTPGEKLHAALRRAAEVPAETYVDAGLDALEAKIGALRAASLMSSVLLSAAPSAVLPRSNGIKLLTREEAGDGLPFGAATAHAKKCVGAAEPHDRKSLADCVRDGDL